MTFWPISDEHCTGVTGDVMHAIDTLAAAKGARTAVCGVELDRAAAVNTNLGSPLVMPWPPYQRDGVRRRCHGCWTATGKPRPADLWRTRREDAA